MKEFWKITIFCSVINLFIPPTNAQTVRFEDESYANAPIAFAYHQADGIYILKEMNADEKGFSLFYFDTLESGMYYLIFPDSTSFEVLYDNTYSGKISISRRENLLDYTLSGPLPTQLYYEYSIANKHSSNTNQKKNTLIDSYISKDNNTLLTSFLKAQKKVQIPDFMPSPECVNQDSGAWMHGLNYYQKHFLDNLDLNDGRLRRTPIYTLQINEYLDKISKQNSTDLIQSIDAILLHSELNSESKKFISNHLLMKYRKQKNNPNYEKVYLHLIKKHFLDAGEKWITNNQINSLTREYTKLLPTSIGQIAPDILGEMPDAGLFKLSDNESDYKIIYFYDYDCSICTKITPHLNHLLTIYDYLNLNLIAVCLGTDINSWKKYISRYKLTDHINIQIRNTDLRVPQKYNLTYTPSLLLLNKENSIIGKNLTTAQLEDLLLKKALKINK